MAVKLVEGNRRDFIKDELLSYIVHHYCHDFETGKQVRKDISKYVDNIATIIVNND